MRNFIFISDFDGTITSKDFYWILLDDYIGQEGIDHYKEWKATHKIGTDYLNKVFTWHSFSKKEHDEILNKVSMDKSLEKVVDLVQSKGGEFLILSAGFRYYIEDALKKRGLDNLKLITNEGDFIEGQFLMKPDPSSCFYSQLYGVDKGKVAQHYKKETQKLIFAGDSEPDYWAAKHADVVFAKNELAAILDEKDIPYIVYNDFQDIYIALQEIL